ncbi:MAG: acyl-CoA--6-aminopenicillanic acid acyltransferase [Rhizobiales bacterium]|nr:acyl-CoA--6-aminopenicillanic acid acyltransferase [Hyphomicrobiales bacterium]
MTEPCPLIDVSGKPYERGRQHGMLAAARIRKGAGHYAAQIAGLNLSSSELKTLIRDYLPVIESFDASYIEEMQGIAQGAEVAFEDVVLLNARTEILKLAERPDLKKKFDDAVEPDGCTAALVMPKGTRNGEIIHAHNWDWKMEAAETCIILRVRNEDGPDYITYTEAGALGRFGFNSTGVAITANYLESDRDYTQIGVPLALIRRKVLEQQHLALALRAVYVTPKSGSNNIIVSHPENIAINMECAPDETFLVAAEDDILAHSNHWLSPVALTKLRDTGLASVPCSLYRHQRIRDLLTPRLGDITVDDVKSALLDKFAEPWSVCRPPRASLINNLTATVATIVMQPAKGIMEVAMLPALEPTFVEYSLTVESTMREQSVAI